ncbi:MAG: divalent-cation tolerance protein CutA [Rubrivivax sp.]
MRIAAALVQRGLAACAQVSAIESVYTWDDALQQQGEFRLLLKTTARQYPAVEAAIRELHSYELPAIFALPVAQADAAYADWVRRQSAGTPSGA